MHPVGRRRNKKILKLEIETSIGNIKDGGKEEIAFLVYVCAKQKCISFFLVLKKKKIYFKKETDYPS